MHRRGQQTFHCRASLKYKSPNCIQVKLHVSSDLINMPQALLCVGDTWFSEAHLLATPSLLVLRKGPFWNDGHKEAKVAQLGFLLIKWDGSRLGMKEMISVEEDVKSLLREHRMKTIPSHAPGEIKQEGQAGTGAPEAWKCSRWSNAAGVRQPGCEFQPCYLPGADYLPCYYCSVAKLCLTLCNPLIAVHQTFLSIIISHLPEFAQTHDWVRDVLAVTMPKSPHL